MMDTVETPDGQILGFPEGVNERAFTHIKEFPLGSKLTKWDGQMYYYCYMAERMEKFWECYVENTGGGQHYKHHSLEEAQGEAERLAREEQGKTVYLFECIGMCKIEETSVRWKIPR